MSNIFEITGKTGRRIRLTKKQWRHITLPTSPHSYMVNHLEKVKESLAKPDKVILSIYDNNKANYYRYYKEKRKYLRIIVKYLNEEGFVITAYFVKNISK